MTIESKLPEQEVDLEYALAAAIGLHQKGEIGEAEAIYQAILSAYPQCPEALHFYGFLNHQKGDHETAIRLIEQALVEAPDYWDAYNNLGNIFVDLEQFERAISAYDKALSLNSNNPAPYSNLGLAYKKLGNFDKAAAAYAQALYHLPYDPKRYQDLCRVLYLQGKTEEAIPLIKQWLEYDPHNPLALHHWSAYTNDSSLPRASDDYICRTFDSFSSSFDAVLQRLDYKAPFWVADAVKEAFDTAGHPFNILDAGCGTGLCGPLIKDYARRVTGVDLSAKMLEKAEQRDCYDELHQAELTAFIGAHSASYDVIVSADTLVYFGDLSEVTQAANQALLPEGHFIFTVERSDQPLSQGFSIHPHGRFSHSEDYVRQVIQSAGLIVKKLEQVMLRYEKGNEVGGFLVMAFKPVR